MRTLLALIAVGILLFGCASQQAQPAQEQNPPPPLQQQKPATPQQNEQAEAEPQTNEQQTPLQPETQPPSQQNQTNESAAEQPPQEKQPQYSEEELLDNPQLAGSPHPKVKSTNIMGCCSHPYYHKVYRAFSSDGISWQKEGALIRDHASVPAIMQRDDGTFILYYVDGEYDTVDCMVSQDGSSFSAGNCAIYGFAGERAWDPYAVRLADGNYRLFYFTPNPELEGDNVIMSATSRDGISFVEDPGIRFSHPQIYDPAVMDTGSGWWMFAGYNPESAPGSFPEPKIVFAKSSDGLTFSRESVLDLGGNVPEIVKLDDGRYALYYCAMGGIAMATSSDGASWSSGATALSSDSGKITCDPSVIKMRDGRWVMYYKVQETMRT